MTPFPSPRDPSDASPEAELDPLALEHGLERRGHVLVLGLQEAPRTLQDGHAAAHAPVELAHLEGDVSGAEKDDVPGQLRPVEPVSRVEEIDAEEARNVGHARPRSGVENDLAREEAPVSDAHAKAPSVPALEARVSHDESRVPGSLQTPTEPVRDRITMLRARSRTAGKSTSTVGILKP